MTAPSTSFSLTEHPVSDGNMSLTLQDRALPYRPISINGRQRAEFTWYPGSPNATVQMLGPEEGVIFLRGFWKDRFLAGTDNAIVLGAPALSQTDTVSDLVRRVDEMRRRGKQICLAWDDLIRYGHITSFTQTWHNHHDCEWEMEFSVISQEDPTKRVSTLAFTAPTVADVAIAATANAQTAANVNFDGVWGPGETAPPSLLPGVTGVFFDTSSTLKQEPPPWWEREWGNLVGLEFAETARGVGGYVELAANNVANRLNNVAQQALYIAQTPSELGRNLLNAIAGPVATLFRAGGSLVDGALTEYFTYAEVFNQVQQDNVPFGIQLGQKSYLTRVKGVIQDIRTSNAIWRAQYTEELMNTTVRTFVAPADMDLRDVCTKFYGTQDGWIDLMLYNGLVVSRIPAGFVVRVPERLDGAPAGRT